MLARHRAAYVEIADQHRGETVLVVGHQTALGLVVPALTGSATPWPDTLGHGPTEVVAVAVDADGWRLLPLS